MSYRDSQGNRISGVHSAAGNNDNDLLNGNHGLRVNPISARNPELGAAIPVAGEMDD